MSYSMTPRVHLTLKRWVSKRKIRKFYRSFLVRIAHDPEFNFNNRVVYVRPR